MNQIPLQNNTTEIVLCDQTQGLERQAALEQRHLISDGLNDRKIQKTFIGLMFNRPSNPFATIATEVMARAVEKRPDRNGMLKGILVDESTLMKGAGCRIIPITLDNAKEAKLVIYNDLSCIVIAHERKDGVMRAVTLPLTLYTHPMEYRLGRTTVSAGFIPALTGPGDLVIRSGDGEKCIVTDFDLMDGHSGGSGSFGLLRRDIGLEMMVMIDLFDLKGPNYRPKPAYLGADLTGKEIQSMNLPFGADNDKIFSALNYGRMAHPRKGFYDMHLPQINVSPRNLFEAQELGEMAARLVMAQAGLDSTLIRGTFRVDAMNCVNGEICIIGFYRTPEEANFNETVDVPEDDVRNLVSHFGTLLFPYLSRLKPFGFRYLFEEGKTGSWAPLSPIRIPSNRWSTETGAVSIEDHERNFEIQMNQALATVAPYSSGLG